MTTKIFVGADQTAVVSCTNCKKSREIKAVRFKGRKNAKIKCRCGNTWRVELEFRSQVRKETDLSGTYKILSRKGQLTGAGIMQVTNLSRNGLQMKLKDYPLYLNIGDILDVRFTLGDKNQTFIKRKAEVRYSARPYVGAMFKRLSDTDSDIGFYLLS